MKGVREIQAVEVREHQEAVPSPCIDVCQLGEDGICEGCLRTADEIARWAAMPDGDRRRLWALLDRRREGADDI
ncbi:MAG: DUF1289 domain-containing protein [Gammaproteobacteria bacterium]|jgi:predicted Fe-S protein YdhL (DUF1289 family)|nr:MAG: DUF1289 domain-containing protein [Gammaproteobacteria bacterium]